MNLSLPAWVYHSEEFLELEKEAIFKVTPQLVCHVSDIPQPGDYETLSLLGQDIVVIRGADDVIRAFYNVCRHRAHRLLGDESGNCGDRIVCPYHAWSYNSAGDLLNVPFAEEYEDMAFEDHGMVAIEHEVYLDFVFIRFENDGRSVAEWLSPIHSDLDHYRLPDVEPLVPRSCHLVQSNWKNGADNYIDALHVRVAHPDLNGLLNKTYGIVEQAEGVYRLEGRVEQIIGKSDLAKRYHQCLPEVAYLPESHNKSWLYFLLWPNLAFNLYPDQVEFMQFLPIDAQQTHIRYGTYAVPDDRPEMIETRELNIALNVEVGKEDEALTTSIQRGMGSNSFVQGPLGNNEVGLLGFAKKMRELIPVSSEREAPSAGQVRQLNAKLVGESKGV